MGSDAGILSLGAVALRDRLKSGALRATELMQACLQRIAQTDPQVQAFEWLDPAFALKQAETADAHRAAGRPVGALHGLPVAVKDIIDTAGIPTCNGTPIDAGRVPASDAHVVRKLKAAGAIMIGKTVTTELAFLHPGKTRNPVNTSHTPGGSSSGSAAAVAAGMVPLAIGTQTGGSVIRPAAFCGVTGFLPSAGTIGRTGITPQSPTLDRVGVFARNPADAALIAAELFGHDPSDKATSPAPHPQLLETALSRPPVKPQFAFLRTPNWDLATPQCRQAMEELAAALGDQCFEASLPEPFAQVRSVRERINHAEMAKCYHRYWRDAPGLLSEELRAALEEGRQVTAHDYIAALDWPDYLYSGLSEIFQRCDAIITPAAPGAAPHGLESTGSSVFNAIWTICGTPVVTLPVFEDDEGMPMGVQIIGPRGGDGRLLRTARWLMDKLDGESGD